jgi:hypothetical protein
MASLEKIDISSEHGKKRTRVNDKYHQLLIVKNNPMATKPALLRPEWLPIPAPDH